MNLTLWTIITILTLLAIIGVLTFWCLFAIWSLRKDIDDVFKKLEFDEKDIAKPE